MDRLSHCRLLVVGILILASAQIGSAWGDGSDQMKLDALEAQAAGGDIEAQLKLADLYLKRGNREGVRFSSVLARPKYNLIK